ncbi:MLO-like protein 14 [Bienertia sinuspersici]
MEEGEGRSLTETPTWAVATVFSLMVASVVFFTKSVEFFAHWLDKRKRKPLLAALNKIKEELMVFGVLSLLMGHWSIFVAKICIKSSLVSARFYPCIPETTSNRTLVPFQHIIISNSSKVAAHHPKHQDLVDHYARHKYCAKGYESFASYESLEQLHRLLFVLGVTHVIYSSMAIALAIIKIYSWRTWEDEAKSMASQTSQAVNIGVRLTSLITLLSDLDLLLSMAEEFRDIVGIRH